MKTNRIIFKVAHILARKGLIEEAGEMRQIARDWENEWFCGKAEASGVIDRLADDGLLSELEVDVLRDAVLSAGADGFEMSWKSRFGDKVDMRECIDEARAMCKRDAGEEIETVCQECGVSIRVPHTLSREFHLCRRHMIDNLSLLLKAIGC